MGKGYRNPFSGRYDDHKLFLFGMPSGFPVSSGSQLFFLLGHGAGLPDPDSSERDAT